MVGAPPDYHQKTLVAQLADAVFHDFTIGLYLIAGVTALILVLAANTAFNGFPVLGSILAQDRYLPRQLHTRGDRLAFSNGILFLAFAAIAFVVAFRAEVTALIQLYIVGVFVSFTLSQIGMVRHWTRLLRTETDPAVRGQDEALAGDQRASVWRCTGTVLVIVVVTKFLAGAWIAILAMGALFVVMKSIHKHYDSVAARARGAGRRGGRRHGVAQPQPRDRAGVQIAPADDAGTGLCPGHPSRHARSDHRQRRRRRDTGAGAQMGGQRHQRCR